ncbi:hypothetical protein AB0M46_26290 [Dactylosporangium sp. NPDC051485]|uniref:hypothetical protein n=1 Tax=Dactylosporangium sp. NPDC051485 TaxID=3154846 RepID=UPI0034402D7B
MTDTWPRADLNPVHRLRALAAGIPGAHVTERLIDAPFDEVWPVAGDLEGEFGNYQPDMRHVRITRTNGDRLEAVARSRFGLRARFDVVSRPGWCWMQSRLLLIGVAAAPADGGTLIAMTGGVRVPGRAAILPWGVRRESAKALHRLTIRVRARAE